MSAVGKGEVEQNAIDFDMQCSYNLGNNKIKRRGYSYLQGNKWKIECELSYKIL